MVMVNACGSLRTADAEDEPNQKYRNAYVSYDADNKDNDTACKLLICDVVKGKLVALPRAVMAAGGIMQGARGSIDIPDSDVDRVKSQLARHYRRMDRTPPWKGRRHGSQGVQTSCFLSKHPFGSLVAMAPAYAALPAAFG
jgi:hypothetical protein